MSAYPLNSGQHQIKSVLNRMDISGSYDGMLPPSPPGDGNPNAITTAARLLRAKASALSSIASTYESDKETQLQFERAISVLHLVLLSGGKVVVTGMGKSFKIASKLVATLQSFSIASTTLHPSEALHGDLGSLNENDAIVMITASGTTPELLLLQQHLPKNIEQICITCKAQSVLGRRSSALILAQVPEEHSEMKVYGLTAPTVTTTACLAVGDAMCVALYESVEQDALKRVKSFGRCHPGGAIGEQYTKERSEVPWDDLPKLPDIHGVDEVSLWRACYSYPYVLCDETLFLSVDIMNALRQGNRSATGCNVLEIPRRDRIDLTVNCGFVIVNDGHCERVVFL